MSTATEVRPDAQEVFSRLLAKASSDSTIAKHIDAKKSKKDLELNLSEQGSTVHRDFQRAYQLAEENGPKDRDVLQIVDSINASWSSYPGVVENSINEAVEAKDADKALVVAEAAVAEWSALFKSAGVEDLKSLSTTGTASGLFVQLLANYEFALERAGKLDEALDVAHLARTIDPTDPENLLSAIVNLSIRLGDAEGALDALAPLSESPAPFVLYGRALAHFALGQPENASAALQTAMRHWPMVAQGISREWASTGTPMPRPGEAVSEAQMLYGYHEVFGAAWSGVPGAMEWLRAEEQKFQRSGGKQAPHVGLTRTGENIDNVGQVASPQEAQRQAQLDAIAKAKVVGEDEFIRFLEVAKHEYVYDATERGKEMETMLQDVFRRELKHHERIDALQDILKQWPGHAEAAITLARIYGGEKKWEPALDILETAIFALQKFWSDDFVGKNHIDVDWPGNKGILRAYAHMVVYLGQVGDNEAALNFAADYLLLNPKDNLGVRQKAIELTLEAGDTKEALRLISEATDQNAAYNMFGKALALFAAGKKDDATKALRQAVLSRPRVYRELIGDKHRMPAKYNPSYVKFFSPEEAYNYHTLWGGLWRKTIGALAWLRTEGRAAIVAAKTK